LSQKKDAVNKNCRVAVNKLHEVMKLLDLAQLNLSQKEKRYMIAFTFFSLWIGFAVADFVAAATVVYSMGDVIGIRPENVFWNPEGGVILGFTWFGFGLVVSFAFILLALCLTLFCSLSRSKARKEVKEMHKKLKDAKSAILDVCPMELWYSGEA
jgi:hypothetical protein